MPKAAPRPCTQPRCRAYATHKGRCDRHQREVWVRRGGSTTERGYGYEWQKLRKQILQRDEHVCQCDDCKEIDRLLPATEVDHITPKSQGGTDNPDNLQAINHDCHKRKTAREAGGVAK